MNSNFYIRGKNHVILKTIDFDIDLLNNNNILDFLRGYIEFNYNIELPINNQDINYNKDKPILSVYFKYSDYELLQTIYEYLKNQINILCEIIIKKKIHNKVRYNYILIFKFNNVLNLLAKIYPTNVNKNEIDEYLYNTYMNLSTYRYISYDTESESLTYLLPRCYVKLIDPSAIMPTKKYASNIGYDISIIKRHKIISDTIIIYDTGLLFNSPFGFYFKLIPKFKLSIDGYLIGNTIGLIESEFCNLNKTLLITLIKINKEADDLKLPYKCCNLLLKEILHYELEQIN